ncbi:MAG: hypothetical protein ABIB47_05715 [Candidatus Woesearchaeota archaeon]
MQKRGVKRGGVDLGKLKGLKPDELYDLFQEFIDYAEKKGGIGKYDENNAPISIFNEKLSNFESIVKYLREECKLDYKRIALKLNRKEGPIGVIYRKAKKKFSGKPDLSSSELFSLNIFNNKLTIFENLVFYFKREGGSFHEVASVLKRNYYTVWAVYQRAKKKGGMK